MSQINIVSNSIPYPVGGYTSGRFLRMPQDNSIPKGPSIRKRRQHSIVPRQYASFYCFFGAFVYNSGDKIQLDSELTIDRWSSSTFFVSFFYFRFAAPTARIIAPAHSEISTFCSLCLIVVHHSKKVEIQKFPPASHGNLTDDVSPCRSLESFWCSTDRVKG